MSDTNQKREDEVLRRLLNTPHKPHKPANDKDKKPRTPAS